ncbi:MAG: SipW-dependent-type signal peptide-containing protein [Clostridiaceae bacterium]
MKNKRMMTVMILALVAIFAGGVTLAYFTDTSDSVENTFTMGNVEIELDEAELKETITPSGTTWTALTERVRDNTYSNLYPGAVLPKDPTVYNVGANPAYIRVKVTLAPYDVFDRLLEADPSVLWDSTLGSGWVLASSANGVYTYNYTNIVTNDANMKIPPLFTSVSIPAEFNNTAMTSINGFTINVVAEAIQSQGFDNVTEAFEEFVAE